MKHAKISDIVGIINKSYAFSLAEDWDSVGLQLGDPTATVERIMVALDPLPEVIDAALERRCQLLVTHHPLIFSPLRQVTASSNTGRQILKSVAGGLSLLAMHTNYDIADGGLNDLLAQKIGLLNSRPLKVTNRIEYAKLVVFVPEDHLTAVRQALFEHAEQMGNYRDCSFSMQGEGTFFPLDGSCPAIGRPGAREHVTEQRLELLIRRDQFSRAVRTLLSVHPYEEPAFDCYPLLNEGVAYGLGRVGMLPEPCSLADYAARIRQALDCGPLRVVGGMDRSIQKVALCSGSGASLLTDAYRAGADLLVTGDIRYHDAREAETLGIALIDAGHFGTERIMVSAISDFLRRSLEAGSYGGEIVPCADERDPFLIC